MGSEIGISDREKAGRAKIAQIMAYGPHIMAVEKLGYDSQTELTTWANIRQVCKANDWMMLVTAHAFSPHAMEGVKTITYEMAEQLRLLINVPTVPTEMIGATKLWAGVAGVRHRFPAGRCEWLAHMRLAVAIASERDASRLPVPWYHQPPRGKTPKLLHAKLGTLMVVVPIHSNVKTLDHIVSRLTQWGGDYAIW